MFFLFFLVCCHVDVGDIRFLRQTMLCIVLPLLCIDSMLGVGHEFRTQLLLIGGVWSTQGRGVPSDFARIMTAVHLRLGRYSTIPLCSICLTHLSMISCARGFMRFEVLSTGSVSGRSENVASCDVQ